MAIRSNVVTLVLAGLLGVLVITLLTKKRESHAVTVNESPAAAESAPAAPSAASPGASAAGSGAAPAKKAPPTLARPLRVAGVGWELIAPVLLQNDGIEPSENSAFGKAGLRLSLSVVDGAEGANQALSRGGDDDAGSDVVLVPLSSFLASYEKLRALDPVIFYVSHWSRGREVLTTRSGKPLDSLPDTGRIGLAPAEHDPATFAALFLLDAAGVEPARIDLLSSDDPKAQVRARMRQTADQRGGVQQSDAVLSTAEASRLVPIVAVAQRGFIQKHALILKTFLLGLLEGQKVLTEDAAASARKISKLDGAPEPVALLGGLGELGQVSLSENAELFGLSGRGAVTVESLLARGFRLWREAKLSTTPGPESVVADGRVVALLIRASRVTQGMAPPKVSLPDKKAAALLVHRARGKSLDEDALLGEVGLLAGVFPRSPLLISVHRGGAVDKKRSEEIARQASDRFGLAPGRLQVGKARPRAQTQATLEVLPIP